MTRTLVALALLLLAAPRRSHTPSPPPGPGDRQTVAPQHIHVHDGDTFYVGADAIRLRGIDTPELGHPRAYDAKRRLITLLRSGPVTIVRRAEDVYGRVVADVYVGGRDVARVLRDEGYAKPPLPRPARRSFHRFRVHRRRSALPLPFSKGKRYSSRHTGGGMPSA